MASIRPITRAHILVVEDDEALSSLLGEQLRAAGHDCTIAANIAEARMHMHETPPDLALLDRQLDSADGLSLLDELRHGLDAGVIVMTARQHEEERIAALLRGADDYVTKPFAMRELLARVAAVLRRRAAPPVHGRQQPAFGDWRLDKASRTLVRQDGRSVPLSGSETNLLLYFLAHPGQTINRDELMRALYRRDRDYLDRRIDILVANLRKKLATQPGGSALIRTVRGAGYLFVGAPP